MTDRKLAARYARALLSTLPDPSRAESADAFLAALADRFEADPALRDTLLNPAHPRTTRKAALAKIVEAHGAPPEVGRFLGVVLDNNRLGMLSSIARVFREERESAAGLVPATVTTATPLSDEMTRRTVVSLERLSGKRIRLTPEVDPSILGGAVTRLGSMIYDGSLRTQLDRLRRRMAQE